MPRNSGAARVAPAINEHRGILTVTSRAEEEIDLAS